MKLCVVVALALCVGLIAAEAPPEYDDYGTEKDYHTGHNHQYGEYAPSTYEVREIGFFERLSTSFTGVIIGIIMFFGSFVLIWWNEGRAVRHAAALEDVHRHAVTIDPTKPLAEHEGKPVHCTGQAVTDERLEDAETGMVGKCALNAIKLARSVEMWQWIQKSRTHTEKQLGGSTREVTEYYYEKQWSATVHNSMSYKQPPMPANPTSMPLSEAKFQARDVRMGEFLLSREQVDKLECSQPCTDIDPSVAMNLANRSGRPGRIVNNCVYLGNNPAAPEIGDVRITFTVLASGSPVSVIAQQNNKSFVPYKTISGESISLCRVGTMTKDAMIADAKSGAKMLLWILRVVGFFCMWIGLQLCFGWIDVIADFIPIIGDLVEWAVGTVSFISCLIFTITTIIVAWGWFNPKVGLTVATVIIASLWIWSMFSVGGVPVDSKGQAGAHRHRHHRHHHNHGY